MAARKQFLDVRPVDPSLKTLLDSAKGRKVSDEELKEQRVSFAYGNAPNSRLITKDSVRTSSRSILIAG